MPNIKLARAVVSEVACRPNCHMGEETAEMTHLVSEATTLALPLLWPHGRNKEKRGKARGDKQRNTETERSRYRHLLRVAL